MLTYSNDRKSTIGSIAVLVIVLNALILNSSCSSPHSPDPTPDPRINDVANAVARIEPDIDRIESVIGRIEARPTPVPTPTPHPYLKLNEVIAIVTSTVADSMEARPMPTAISTPTPGITLKQVKKLVDERISLAIGSLPSPALDDPDPTSIPFKSITDVSNVSGPATISISDNVTLSIAPGRPFAGSNIKFTLDGLTPWQKIGVTFIDPLGQSIQWVNDNDAILSTSDGEPLLERLFFANNDGVVEWSRAAISDSEGLWSVNLNIGGRETVVVYPLVELQIADRTENVGIEFKRYRGQISTTYFSALVPSALALDLQSHMAQVVKLVEENLGIQAREIPDIYLVNSRTALEHVSEHVGVTLTSEDGYYKPYPPRSGIYLRTDFQRSDILRMLTHEYVHLVLMETVDNALLPAWLNEGIASYIEFEVGVQDGRLDSDRRWLYASAEIARDAAISDTLPTLTSLENQVQWSKRLEPVIVAKQYAEAHMAVRFLAGKYGIQASLEIAKGIASGLTIDEAIFVILGVNYNDFQDSFYAWLIEWEDPSRIAVREYISYLDDVVTFQASILNRRETYISEQASSAQRLTISEILVIDAQSLLDGVVTIAPPTPATKLHDQTVAYLDKLVKWLTLESEFISTGIAAKRKSANDMILEIDARRMQMLRGKADLEFRYKLDL